MFPGMGNPRQMAEMMRQLGIKSEEIDAEKVTIEKKDGSKIVVTDAQVTQIEMKGSKSFQVAGSVSEEAAGEDGDGKGVQNEDVAIIVSQTGCSEQEAADALQQAGGDIAQAILLLKKE